jgi:hypothetical protein
MVMVFLSDKKKTVGMELPSCYIPASSILWSFSWKKSWDVGVVIIPTRLRPGQASNCGSIPRRHRRFSLLQSIQTVSGMHPASNWIGKPAVFSSGAKLPGHIFHHSPSCNAEIKEVVSTATVLLFKTWINHPYARNRCPNRWCVWKWTPHKYEST